ncbi:anti-sigma-I factor RsgI family protein [Virgibacillus halodenitrificans]|uniref:anti-sigma-I factor RsgI family protein n=1 Tax=Virgibacillus halodenitrificans TaxID=1482 RepID=UPI00045CE0E9|nr:hypothetical protein [Virgibacillus halodenitrificans]CDQ32213.1 Regulation of sigma I protein [Virgibacillus halodenitrificans]
MKKGIVMEKHSHYTIVMEKGGAFYKAKPIDAMVGSEVCFEPFDGNKKTFLLFPTKKVSTSVRLLSMACVLLLLVLPFYFIVSVNKTYAYVNIDINPSVELELNKDLKVQSIHSLNKDGKELVSNLSDYKNQNVEKVIRMIMKESEHSGMINDQKNILVGVSYANGEVKDISVLEQVDNSFQKKRTDWSVVTFNVPKHVREEAKNSNKSMNELMAGLVNKDQNKQGSVSMNDQERAIIHSFYTDDNDHSKKETEESSLKIKEKNKKEPIHEKETNKPPVSQNNHQMKQENSNDKKASSNTSNKQRVEKEKYNPNEKKNNSAENNKQKVEEKKNNSHKKQEQSKDQKRKNNHSNHDKNHQNQSHHSYDKEHHKHKYNKNKHKEDKQDDDDDDEDHDDDKDGDEDHDEREHDKDD